MNQLYVVRVPFKSAGKFYAAGTFLRSLENIKLAKIKLNEQKIVPVPEDEKGLAKLHDWFYYRHKVDFKKALATMKSSQGSGSAATVKPNASAIPTTPGTQSAPAPLSGAQGTTIVQPPVK